MKLISLTICRNSAWSIEPVITHALKYCDEAVVLAHACEDNTVEILRKFDDRIHIISTEKGPEWDEMAHRQKALEEGRVHGGTHFVILDDDEIMAEHLVPVFRAKAETLLPGELLRMPMRGCWRAVDQYRSDPGNPFTKCQKSVVFADSPNLHWKDDSGYQHHHTHPYNCTPWLWATEPGVGWMHFQHAYWPRLLVKQTWYMCMELCRYGEIRANYKGTMDEKGLETSPVPDHWKSPEIERLDLTAEPWQVKDIRRMVEERGEKFFTRNGVEIKSILAHW
jgi:hypothetical protein